MISLLLASVSASAVIAAGVGDVDIELDTSRLYVVRGPQPGRVAARQSRLYVIITGA